MIIRNETAKYFLPRTEKTVVRIAAEVTRRSDREFIHSKLMRNVILKILFADLRAK